MKANNAKSVLIVGSFAPSLITFRGPLISAMIDRGHRVVAAAPALNDPLRNSLLEMGAEPAEIPVTNVSINPWGLVVAVRAMRSLIRRERPDAILAYTIKPVIAAGLAAKGEKRVRVVALITGAGYAFTGGHEIKRLVSRCAATLLYRLALRRAQVILFQNPDDERLFRRLRLVPPGRETHIVNGSGVDLQHFSPVALPRGTAFLMIARLLKDKGIREFAAAAKRLKAAHPQVPIILAGDLDPSPDSLTRSELNELIGCGIDYRGYLADVRPAIAECSVYVLPSYREGTPRSVLEAMAMGRAIITTDAPGCRETVTHGENGFLVPPRNADSLFDAMMRFVGEPALASRMGRASRERAEAKYDVRDVNAMLLRYAGLSC